MTLSIRRPERARSERRDLDKERGEPVAGGKARVGPRGLAGRPSARERTGRGQHVDVSYLDTSVSLLAATPNMRFFFSDGVAPRRGEGFLGGSYPYYAIYETRDGKLLTIGCTEPWLWENFCKAIGRPDFVQFARKPDQFVRAANPEEAVVREVIEAVIRTRDRDDWYEFLVKHDVCVGKVYDVEEMVARALVDPERLRGLFGEIEPTLHRFPAVDPPTLRPAVLNATRSPWPLPGPGRRPGH